MLLGEIITVAVIWLALGYAGWCTGAKVFESQGLEPPYDLLCTTIFGPINLLATIIIYFQEMKPKNKL